MSVSQMTLEEAKAYLARYYRVQYGDGSGEGHSYTVDWFEQRPGGDVKPKLLANGQFWPKGEYRDGLDIMLPDGWVEFVDADARALAGLGIDCGMVVSQEPTNGPWPPRAR